MTQGENGQDALEYERNEVVLAMAEVRAACSSLLALCAEDKSSLGDRFAALALQQISQLLKDQTSGGRLFRPCVPSGCLPKSFLDFRPVSQTSDLPVVRKRLAEDVSIGKRAGRRELALRALLTRIRQISRGQQQRAVYAKMKGHPKAAVGPISKSARSQEVGNNFNIFNILRIQHKEVITHSRLLGTLLDPYGIHGQGTLFLDAFLRLLHQHQSSSGVFWPSSREWRASGKGWRVYEEHHTAFGRLDLLLENQTLQAAIVVENKLGASDQPGQLQRYWSWLEAERGHWPYVMLVYLSPAGLPPAQLALDAGDPPQPQQNLVAESLVCLSYRQDIARLLQGCWRKNYSGDLACILRQYLRIIERF